ncbi:MAG: NAD(P)-binding domain-containing protein, partial [Chloroflexota bacterium]|nr:NAD(P)-binding domain-containing protein [Chloroflexota bacterium]
MHAAFIGIGEVGSCLARELARRGLEVTAYRRSQLGMRKAVQAGVSLFGSLAEALEGADVVFSCVWPHTALEVAKEAAAL